MAAPSRPSIALVTTCKGRLAHLRQTLPAMLKTGLPVTVVDFDCPDGTQAYLAANFPEVNVVAVKDQPVFSPAIARNLGARSCDGELIIFADADCLFAENLSAFLAGSDFTPDEFYTCGTPESDLVGLCLTPRQQFEAVGGYDEVMVGWANEDLDLYLRLKAAGARRRDFPAGIATPLRHSDEMRVALTGNPDKWASYRLNAIYSFAKIDAQYNLRRQLNLSERRQIREIVRTALARADAQGELPAFAIALDTLVAPGPPDRPSDGAFTAKRMMQYKIKLG